MSNSVKAVVYSSTHCTYCKQLKTYLSEQNIEFEERNIDDDEAYAKELQDLGMSSVPVTVIGGTTILGLNPSRIKKAVAAIG
ncbi:MAG: NrdH-redoxin [Paenibacillaceae bacterium]|jgi:glutaredoxin|nr:NrdH-redoxin [Paenibacillaceae bacterium]